MRICYLSQHSTLLQSVITFYVNHEYVIVFYSVNSGSTLTFEASVGNKKKIKAGIVPTSSHQTLSTGHGEYIYETHVIYVSKSYFTVISDSLPNILILVENHSASSLRNHGSLSSFFLSDNRRSGQYFIHLFAFAPFSGALYNIITIKMW